MAMVIPFPTEMEARIRERAAAEGKDATTFVLQTVEEKLQGPPSFREIFAPIQEAFGQGQVEQDEMDRLLEEALNQTRGSGGPAHHG
jgi:hypothetical protein